MPTEKEKDKKKKRAPNKNQPNRAVNEAYVCKFIGKVEILRYITKYRTPESKPRGYFECRCECGNVFEGRCDNIREGIQTHCGCQKRKDYAEECKICGNPRDSEREQALCRECSNEMLKER